MAKLEIMAISANLEYLFTNRGVVKVSNKLNDLKGQNILPYINENLDVAVDILKENILFKYKTNQITIDECLGEPRKFLYKLVETFRPENYYPLINEWEKRFGEKLMILNESSDKLLVEKRLIDTFDNFKILIEQEGWSVGGLIGKGLENIGSTIQKGVDWTKSQAQQLKQKGLIGYGVDKAKALFKYVTDKISSAFKCIKSGIECVMEGFKGIMMSVGGTVAMAGVSTIPVFGQIANAILYGVVLLWDLYKMASGKYTSGPYAVTFIDIIFDMLSLIPGAGAIAKGAKTAMAGIKSFSQLGKVAATKGGIFAKVFNFLKKGVSSIQGLIGQAAKWVGEKLGFKALADWGSKASQKVAQLTDEMAQGAGQATSSVATKPQTQSLKQQVKQIWKTDQAMPTTKQIVKAAGGTLAISAGICAVMGLTITECGRRLETGQMKKEEYAQAEKEYEKKLAQDLEQNIDINKINYGEV